MKQYVGLDVSMEETKIHVLDEEGGRVWRGKCRSEPGTIAATLSISVQLGPGFSVQSGPTLRVEASLAGAARPGSPQEGPARRAAPFGVAGGSARGRCLWTTGASRGEVSGAALRRGS